MADLLSTFANAYQYDPNSVWRGAQGVQNVMSNALDYQQKREALEAQRGLRALYAQNPNPSYEDIARISPEFAMQQNKANFELQKEMLGMQETQGKINEQQAAIFAKTGAQIAEKYARKIFQGQFTQEDLSKFHQEVGTAMAGVEKQYGIKPPPGANIEMLDPISVLTNAAPYYKSPALDVLYGVQKQGMLNQMPPQMTPQQAYGGVEKTPYGFMRVPGIGGQPMTPGPQYGVTPFNPNAGQRQGASQQPAPYSFQAPSGAQFDMYDLGSAAQMAAAMPAGPDKDAALKYIDEQWSKMRSGQGGEVVQPNAGQMMQPPAGGFITPQQEMQMRIEEKAAEAGATATAKAEVERSEENKRITDAFKRAVGPGGVSRVMKLISESTSGPTEEMAAQVVSGLPRPGGSRATSGMENIGSLTTIAKELSKTIERSPGPQSDKDVLLASLAAAAIDNPSIPYNQRMKGFLEFARLMKERAGSMGIDPAALGIDIDTNTGLNIPTARTDAEADELVKTLKPGDSFVGPDGKTHTIRGR